MSDTSDTSNAGPKWNYEFITSGAPRQPNEGAFKYNLRKLFTVKSWESLEQDQRMSELRKELNVFELIMIGLGSIIGTGIFVLTGQVAATKAGPAVVISFLLAGLAASFAALSYSELASMIPMSGSSYTYTYTTMGELIAWIIGWDLTLEYLVGAATVSVAYFNVPAFTIVVLLTTLLVLGVKESARVNAIVVSVKVVVIILFVIAAGSYIKPENYQPFVPPNEGTFSRFGVTGILAGTSVVFFAFIGFDSISTIAQESRNAQRDMPIAIMGTSYKKLDSAAPIAVAVSETGMKWLGIIVDLGAVCAAALFPIDVLAELTSVVPGGPFLIPLTGAALTLLILATASPATNNQQSIDKEQGMEMMPTNEVREQSEDAET
ncbi:7950_t:CDS:2, partial [Racocetra fulgida]